MELVLVGNPNSGKTSLFNALTGMNQRVGNYPGITVDKRSGRFEASGRHQVVDIPGIYSLFPGSEDERIAVESILDYRGKKDALFVALIDIQTAAKNLLLLAQLVDLGVPIVGVLNIRQKSSSEEIESWLTRLQEAFSIPWYAINANSGQGISALKDNLQTDIQHHHTQANQEFLSLVEASLAGQQQVLGKKIAHDLRLRWEQIDQLIPHTETSISVQSTADNSKARTAWLDRWLMHPIFGYLLFFAALLLMFQAIFSWAEQPMDWIESGFGWISTVLSSTLPDNYFTRAITEGVLPGLAGVVVFVPQITFLFLFISIFEESGYMTRVVYLMDRLVKPFGLSGRSVVPLISGYACAIPAIMATRTIKHPREKLITMLVIPFMTCSARIPVYTTLIALMVSEDEKVGPFNLQGLILLALYFFGAFMSFVIALISHKIMQGKGRSLLMMELPNYKVPSLRNVGLTIYEKSKSFVFQAGKVILLVSLALYFLANIGFNETYRKVTSNDPEFTAQYTEHELAKLKLENSLIGQMGKGIEPVIKPLGYDWRIGISLVTSFAAREVFVGTMSTIYALEDAGDDPSSIVEQMRNDVDESGKPRYTLAVLISLLVFYALAMQCLSTVAVMYKETGGWKWPIIQLVLATGLAYLLAFVCYQVLA